jgi:hypothetical protein
LVADGGQPLALLYPPHFAIHNYIIPVAQKPTPVLFEDVSLLRHESLSLHYGLGIATLRKYSEIVKPAALARPRIFTASAFVATNRKMISRLWLGATSGLPTRFGITASFWYYLYQVN